MSRSNLYGEVGWCVLICEESMKILTHMVIKVDKVNEELGLLYDCFTEDDGNMFSSLM
jgi:hypothetical protein